jgi:uncharacterized protein (TIGR01777 family)
MKVLITGATGLLGSEIVKLLLQNGVKIHYLTTSKAKVDKEENFKGFYWNPQTSEIDVEAFDEVETIIHLAGAPINQRWTSKGKQEIIESRVLTARLLFQTLSKRSHTVKHFISASAIGIYPHDFNKIYTETENEIDDSFLANVVAKWEDEADQFARLSILVSKVRIGLVLAKEGGALVEFIKPIKLGLGASFGTGNQYQSWIHIHDLAALFYFIHQNALEGIFNAVAPYPVTNSELTKAIAKKMSKPLFLPNLPKGMLKLLLGEMHTVLYTSHHVSARKILDKGFQFKYASIDKALQHLL